jgi:hypothetical protein
MSDVKSQKYPVSLEVVVVEDRAMPTVMATQTTSHKPNTLASSLVLEAKDIAWNMLIHTVCHITWKDRRHMQSLGGCYSMGSMMRTSAERRRMGMGRCGWRGRRRRRWKRSHITVSPVSI